MPQLETKKDKRTTLKRITDFLSGSPVAKTAEDEEMDKKYEDEETKKSDDEAGKNGKKTKKSTEDPDKDTDDEDPDKDTDDDDATMSINGIAVDLNDKSATRSAIDQLLEVIAEKDAENVEMKEMLSAAAKDLAKTKDEVKNDIKSSFIPKGSNRSTTSAKVATAKETPSFSKLKEGSLAANAAKMALANAKK
jgi:ATP-dependent Clp protease protease subunit